MDLSVGTLLKRLQLVILRLWASIEQLRLEVCLKLHRNISQYVLSYHEIGYIHDKLLAVNS